MLFISWSVYNSTWRTVSRWTMVDSNPLKKARENGHFVDNEEPYRFSEINFFHKMLLQVSSSYFLKTTVLMVTWSKVRKLTWRQNTNSVCSIDVQTHFLERQFASSYSSGSLVHIQINRQTWQTNWWCTETSTDSIWTVRQFFGTNVHDCRKKIVVTAIDVYLLLRLLFSPASNFGDLLK